MKNPTTPAEWQEAVDMAYGFLAVNDARLYGLITGGPQVNVERARQLLAEGRKRGILPADDAIERVGQMLVKEERAPPSPPPPIAPDFPIPRRRPS